MSRSRALAALLAELRARQVHLKVEGEQLRLQAPKGVLTPALQQELKEHKEALVQFLRAARTSPTLTVPLGARARNGRVPLSYAQEGAWFIDRLQPGTAFNILVPFRMAAEFREDDFRAIFADVTARHESLRTRFGDLDGVPYQIIENHVRVPFDVMDLQGVPPEARRERLLDIVSQQSRVPFDLGKGPLIRVTVVLVGERDFAVLPVVHHIVFDGWSVGVFQRDIARLYRARVTGEAPDLPCLEVQYPDYALWEREVLSREVFDRQLGYWRRQLADLPPDLNLAHDLLPTRDELFRGDVVSVPLRPQTVEQLHALARAEGVTLFMLLLGAFRAVLMRHTGQDDVIVGTTVAQRSQEAMADVIGFCVNVVPLRTEMSGNPSFRELLARERRTCLDAYENQDLPFGQLVRALSPDRRVGDSPLYRAQFALWDRPPPGAGFEGMPTVPLFESANGVVELNKAIANLVPAFDELSLYGIEDDSRFALAMHYRKDLFDAESMLSMLAQIRTFLEAVALDPDITLWEAPLLDRATQHMMSVEWPGEVGPAPAETVLDRFERQVASTPTALAVTEPGAGPPEGSRSLTYAELNERANCLAHHLIRQGLRPEQRVAICLEKSLETIVSVLGTIKAGLAFVPLDPTQGPVRLRRMMETAGVEVAVTGQGLVPESAFDGLMVIHPGSGDEPRLNPHVQVDPAQLAYVVFTSGTTGEPKGVMVTHGALAAAYRAWETAYDLPSVRTHLQMANVAFDVFVGDLVRALCSGGHLVLCPRDTLLDPRELHRLLSRHRVECAEFVPAVVRSLLDDARRWDLPLEFMKLILVGSDHWSAAEYLALKELAAGSTRVINSYGVAEATIDSSYYMAEGDVDADRALPIGRPFDGSLLYVLDCRLGLAGPGVPGELYLGGSGVARGYVGDPAATGARFVPNPYSGLPGDRLYRTGDRARWRADGQLEFLGRVDDQVKVRGIRIEPGEIEQALGTHPAVEECAVVARSDGPGNERRLVAYVVLNGAAPAAAPNHEAGLRRHLRERLPEYMVPAAIVFLDRLPLTPNGKVDRRGLPSPGWSALRGPDTDGPDTDGSGLMSPTELALADIFRDVLGVEVAGAGSDFFALGGHSLKASQIVHRVRDRLNVELPLRSVFETPVLRDLAATIDGTRRSTASLPPILPLRREGPVPLSYAQEGAWFTDQMQPGALFNIALPFHLRGALDVDALRGALAGLVARHEVLRTVFTAADGVPAQVVLPPADPAFENVDRCGLHGPERDEALLRELADRSSESFDLQHGPLFKTHLIRLSDDEHVLLIVAHHIVFDGYSAGILGRDLAALYESHRSGGPPLLPHLPVQYADYAVWEREVLSGKYLEQHLDFWRRTLEGCPPGLNLPSETQSRAARGTETALLGLSKSFSDSLRRLCEREGVSLFMLLGAAFKALLSRYTGQEDIVVGTPVATRGQAEMADVIGFCVNVLALRTDLSGNPTFRELLRREKEVCLDAYAHQELPFGLMVQKLHPDRYLDRSPFFSVGFGLLQTLGAGRLPEFESDALLGIDRQTWVEKLAIHAEAAPAQDQMFLQIVDTGAELSAVLEHSSSMFAPETIERMLRHYERLLQAAAENPESRLHDPELVDEQDRLALTPTASHLEVPIAGGLHRLLEERARTSPDAVAVVVTGMDGETETRVTYDALNRRANRLARYLITLGAGPERRVAICLERSADLLVALWAVLKAGAAYVPMDCAQRPSRLEWLLEDSGASVLVTSGSHFAGRDVPAGHVVRLDEHAPAIEAMDGANPDVECSEQQAAYLIYTSGSTGHPKAVVVEHRALVNGYHAWRDTYGLDSLGCLLQLANFAFDVFTQDVIRALSSGAALVLCPRDSVLVPSELCDLVDRYGVEFVEFVPAVARNFMAYLEETGRRLPTLRRVVVGADVCYESELAKLRRSLGPEARVFNSYGVTEGSIDDTWFERSDPELAPDSPAPIGRPFANVAAHVLDTYLRLAPVGGAGELYLGGAAVSRCYFGRPGLTAQRYVPDPFGPPGSRLYRTGDLVRRRSDGNLVFLGRRDGQMKVRGFRIEPGEVEVRLAEHPGVGRALVVGGSKGRGRRPAGPERDERLVAYVEGDASQLSEAGLREFLLDRLPGYMVPSSFVIMDSLPTTTSGKVDLKALPEATLEAVYVAPRTTDEIVLSRIWAEVLGIERVGIHDSFAALGGHSLLAARLVARVRAQLEVDLPLRVLFENPTIAGMARAVDRIRSSGAQAEEEVDLEAEARLAEDIQPGNGSPLPLGEAGNILLTGATGFLGAYLLRELLHQTKAEIHCLVRAEDAAAAAARTRRSLDQYGLWDDAYRARVHPLAGAVDQDRLGLAETEYQVLAHRIDAIVHNAATVGTVHSYGALREDNVAGTENILRFACTTKDKPVHHVSTLSVFPAHRWAGGTIEEDLRVDPTGLNGGYPMSKWVAEQLVLEAGTRGLPVAVYRPGRIVKDCGPGPLSPTDMAGLPNLNWLLELGSIPPVDDTPALDLVPVDYAAASIVGIARNPASVGRVFHLNNPNVASFADVVAALRRAGYQLEEVSAKAWAVEVYRRLATAPPPTVRDALQYIPATLRDVLEQWERDIEEGECQTIDLPAPGAGPGPGRSRVDCRRTLGFLEGTGIVCPPTADLLPVLIEYLRARPPANHGR